MPAPEGEYFEPAASLVYHLLLGRRRGLVLCLFGALLRSASVQFFLALRLSFFFTLCCGCLFWTIVHHATDAEWSVVVRRQLENIAGLLLVLAFFLCRFFFFAPSLFSG